MQVKITRFNENGALKVWTNMRYHTFVEAFNALYTFKREFYLHLILKRLLKADYKMTVLYPHPFQCQEIESHQPLRTQRSWGSIPPADQDWLLLCLKLRGLSGVEHTTVQFKTKALDCITKALWQICKALHSRRITSMGEKLDSHGLLYAPLKSRLLLWPTCQNTQKYTTVLKTSHSIVERTTLTTYKQLW